MKGNRLLLREKKLLESKGMNSKDYLRLKDYLNKIVVFNVRNGEIVEVQKNA